MLTEQLIGLEGWRVEVVDKHGDRRRFIVGRNGAQCSCRIHLEIKRRDSQGGMAADREYHSVRKLYKVL